MIITLPVILNVGRASATTPIRVIILSSRAARPGPGGHGLGPLAHHVHHRVVALAAGCSDSEAGSVTVTLGQLDRES